MIGNTELKNRKTHQKETPLRYCKGVLNYYFVLLFLNCGGDMQNLSAISPMLSI